MNIRDVASGFFRLGKRQSLRSQTTKVYQKNKDSEFNFGLYGLITFLLLGSVAGVNWLIDPLWYSHGNILTGQNFAFNERITKTNLFLRTKDKVNYDCIIIGSSRVTALRPSEFKNKKCFNYALKGGEIPDFVNYAKFIQEQGVKPKIVYIGVDGMNFVEKQRTEQPPLDIKSLATQSPLQAYLSSDVLLFSAMTILGLSPDPGNYYDKNFEPVDFESPPTYTPEFYKPLEPQRCDLASVKAFADLRQVFPDAKFVGYVPPISAWSIINDTYNRNLVDCYLLGYHQLAQTYDAMYDFTAPSVITKNPDNTFDGSHFSVKVNNQIAAVLQGKSGEDIEIRVDQYSFDEYRKIYRQKLRDFLDQNNELQLWQASDKLSVDMVDVEKQ